MEHLYLALDLESKTSAAGKSHIAAHVTPDPRLEREDPPAIIRNIKSPELKAQRLAAWSAEQELKRQTSIATKLAKRLDEGALHWWTGEVILIVAIDLVTGLTKVYDGPIERDLLEGFCADLQEIFPRHVLIGKHSALFDLPYLRGRLMAHVLGLPPHLRVQPYRPLQDVNHIFSTSSQCAQIGTLDDYAFGLGIPGKTGKATEVASLHDAALGGDDLARKKLIDYCTRDTAIVVEMLRRFGKDFPRQLVEVPDVV